MNDLTLCLIVKNEEAYIASCIESVLPFVKKIRIADTGSTDNTVSICKRYTHHVEEIDFSLGFSVARNHLLRQVDTRWVLFLDADEYFDTSEIEKLCTHLKEVADEVDAFCLLRYNFFSTGAFYTSDSIKVFRSSKEIFYTGVIVDSVKPSLIKKGGRIEEIPVILNHFGHARPVHIRNEKAYKYLKMMDEELFQNPDNFKVMGYKALVLRTLGKLDAARKTSEKALALAPEEGHPYFVKGHIDRAFGLHKEAADAYTQAISKGGMQAVYLNSRGIAYLAEGLYDKAEQDFSLGQKLFPSHVHFTINQGLVDQARGDYKIASEKFLEVGQKYPAFFKTDFQGCTEVDPYSGYIYDTAFNFHGLAYHYAYCLARVKSLL